jgi:hypothetical protein
LSQLAQKNSTALRDHLSMRLKHYEALTISACYFKPAVPSQNAAIAAYATVSHLALSVAANSTLAEGRPFVGNSSLHEPKRSQSYLIYPMQPELGSKESLLRTDGESFHHSLMGRVAQLPQRPPIAASSWNSHPS